MPKRTIKEIKAAIPDLKSEKVEILADELDRIETLKAVFDSEGGKMLITLLRQNCEASLMHLRGALADRPSLDVLMGHIAQYNANTDLLAQLQDISVEEEIRRQLDEAVKEAAADL